MSDMNAYTKAVKDLDLALQDAGLELTRALVTQVDREVGTLLHDGARIANDQRVELETWKLKLAKLVSRASAFHTFALHAHPELAEYGTCLNLTTTLEELDEFIGDAETDRLVALLNAQELWCVHLQGPDDLIAQPDHDTAVKRAAEVNATIESVWSSREPSEFDPPKPVAAVTLWPYTKGHAEDLAKHGGNPEEWF